MFLAVKPVLKLIKLIPPQLGRVHRVPGDPYCEVAAQGDPLVHPAVVGPLEQDLHLGGGVAHPGPTDCILLRFSL